MAPACALARAEPGRVAIIAAALVVMPTLAVAKRRASPPGWWFPAQGAVQPVSPETTWARNFAVDMPSETAPIAGELRPHLGFPTDQRRDHNR
jgi:hypothetical protein